jgi:ABC-type Co2+ transport system permease subunit
MTSATGFLVEPRFQTAPFPVLILFLVAGVSLTTYVVYFIIKESRFRRRAQYTMASVVAVRGMADLKRIEGPTVGRGGWAPVVAFTGPDRRLHSYTVRRPVILRFNAGSQVRICYDPDNPSRVFLASPVDPSMHVAAMMGVCGVVIAIASAVISVHRLI